MTTDAEEHRQGTELNTSQGVSRTSTHKSDSISTQSGSDADVHTSRPEVITVTTTQDTGNTTPSPTEKDAKVTVQVSHVSHQSTETGDSKMSMRRFAVKWPLTSGILAPGIHMYTPITMILLGFAGLFGALGHHLYNTHLHQRPVGADAQWPQRWGVAMAFFVKMTLVGAVQMAVKQRAWLTVKKRSFKVRTLDSIFHSCYDPAEFLDRELFTGAFLPALLALLVWILPLSAIASPSTLTAENGMRTASDICSNASILDFSLENGFGITRRQPNVDKSGMSFWDTFYDNDTSTFNQPSMDSRRIFQLSMLSERPLQAHNPCPSNSNCTVSVSFAAPSYKCEPRDDFGGMQTYNMSQMAPFGDLLYASYSSFEEDFVGRPLDWNRTDPNDDTGVFKKEPSLWVGWVWNTTLPATSENATKWNTSYWGHQLNTHVMECKFWNSTYYYDLSFAQGQMNVTRSAVRQDKLLLESGEVMAPWMPTYMEYAGFHGTGWLYRTMLAGNISQKGQDSWVMTESDISQTQIIDPGSALPFEEDLVPYIETAFQNIYLSMLSDDKQFSQKFVDLPCQVHAQVLVWSYKPTWLAVSYFIAVGLTFIAVGVGLHAIVTNGYVAQTNFSTFLVTTRNCDLDKMAEGSELGSWPLKKELRQTRLRFGQTRAEPDVRDGSSAPSQARHAAFGLADQIDPLHRRV